MSSTLRLTAADGHAFDAYVAEPEGTPRGGLIVVQEIFGVNSHIRSVADGFARDGYRALAPALFDRVERGVEMGYDEASIQRGREIAMRIAPDKILADVAATLEALKPLRTGIVGYCLGGRVAWVAAATLPLAAAVIYYGGGIAGLDVKPRCPTLCHFGGKDSHIPLSDVETIRARNPEVEIHVYDNAGHGFNCDQRGSYDAESARIARGRTLAFLRTHVG